jgi:hypothetical protein
MGGFPLRLGDFNIQTQKAWRVRVNNGAKLWHIHCDHTSDVDARSLAGTAFATVHAKHCGGVG